MSGGVPPNDRLMELLADRATQGLSAPEEGELAALARTAPLVEAESFDRAASAAWLAMEGATHEPLPAALRARLVARGRDEVLSRVPSVSVGGQARRDVIGRIEPARPTPRSMTPGGLGWLAAAACLALAVSGWMGNRAARPEGTAAVDATSAKEALVASAGDLTRWEWASLGELAQAGVSGDVVWSSSQQQGYMTFKGLRPNDPTREQFQLWIFDPTQSDKTPIDGGVFDVRTAGTAVVAIDPKLRPSGPVMFAVTIEKPGGVVVSDRSRLVLLAKPS